MIVTTSVRCLGWWQTVATQYLQPTAALLFCLFGGWVWSRHSKIKELEQGNPEFTLGWFGKFGLHM